MQGFAFVMLVKAVMLIGNISRAANSNLSSKELDLFVELKLELEKSLSSELRTRKYSGLRS